MVQVLLLNTYIEIQNITEDFCIYIYLPSCDHQQLLKLEEKNNFKFEAKDFFWGQNWGQPNFWSQVKTLVWAQTMGPTLRPGQLWGQIMWMWSSQSAYVIWLPTKKKPVHWLDTNIKNKRWGRIYIRYSIYRCKFEFFNQLKKLYL